MNFVSTRSQAYYMHQYISAALFVFNFLIDENHFVNFTGATFALVTHG